MKAWQRRGEWLEWQAPQAIEDAEAAHKWASILIGENGVRKLFLKEGLQWKGRRLLLRLFPDEPSPAPHDWTEAELFHEIPLIFEDDFCLVANKPSGMKVHPTASGERGTLLQGLGAQLELSGQSCRPRHIHRLDEDTTGPVLFAKTDWAQGRLDAMMREKRIDRTYVAFVQGRIAAASGRIDAPIGRDRHHATRRRVSPGGEPAATRYERLETYRDASLVRLSLETGRTHQIRVHMSHMGHPLIGDTLYGGRSERIGRQALHGERLRFPHPFTDEAISVDAPWPDDFAALEKRLKK